MTFSIRELALVFAWKSGERSTGEISILFTGTATTLEPPNQLTSKLKMISYQFLPKPASYPQVHKVSLFYRVMVTETFIDYSLT